jgi:hypothetical protein
MIVIVLIVVLLVLVAVGTGLRSRRRAAERARVERERRTIASELSGHRQEHDANAMKAGEVAAAAREHRQAAGEHHANAQRHEREAGAHDEAAEQLESRFVRAQGAASRHGERAAEAARRLEELDGERRSG